MSEVKLGVYEMMFSCLTKLMLDRGEVKRIRGSMGVFVEECLVRGPASVWSRLPRLDPSSTKMHYYFATMINILAYLGSIPDCM